MDLFLLPETAGHKGPRFSVPDVPAWARSIGKYRGHDQDEMTRNEGEFPNLRGTEAMARTRHAKATCS